jgi:hypothetical protein
MAALIVAQAAPLSARQAASREVAEILHRAGERVTEYFARAQSLICLEKVALQKLNLGWSAEGPARLVESELRLSWEPTPENPVPTEAKTLRQVVRVNGSKPRKNDYDNCTTPEQNDTEEQPVVAVGRLDEEAILESSRRLRRCRGLSRGRRGSRLHCGLGGWGRCLLRLPQRCREHGRLASNLSQRGSGQQGRRRSSGDSNHQTNESQSTSS